jgi:hypothetical protein
LHKGETRLQSEPIVSTLKPNNMLHNKWQQEILLAYNSSWLTKMYAEKVNTQSMSPALEIERIEEACWDGFLSEILPEICGETTSKKQLYIWAIREYNSFLEIDMGEYPSEKDQYFCIDPYKFIAIQETYLFS